MSKDVILHFLKKFQFGDQSYPSLGNSCIERATNNLLQSLWHVCKCSKELLQGPLTKASQLGSVQTCVHASANSSHICNGSFHSILTTHNVENHTCINCCKKMPECDSVLWTSIARKWKASIKEFLNVRQAMFQLKYFIFCFILQTLANYLTGWKFMWTNVRVTVTSTPDKATKLHIYERWSLFGAIFVLSILFIEPFLQTHNLAK